MNDESESVVLTIEHVKCRLHSNLGKLVVFPKKLVWRDNEESKNEVVHDYIDIRTQRVSPATKTKVQLQICPISGDSSTFQFVNPGGHESQLSDREMVKDAVQGLMVTVRRDSKETLTNNTKNHGTMKEKERILEANEQLKNLYRDLVITGIITAQEFWDDYASQSKIKMPLTQSVGTSAGFLSNLRKLDGCNGIKVNLSYDVIQSIFKTYPAVERKHLELVPHEMNEEEFWQKFFQSHYFYRNRTTNLDPKDVFSDCVRFDETDLQSMAKKGTGDEKLNLEQITDEIPVQNDEEGPSNSKASNVALIRQFNYHSGRVLRSCLGDAIEASLPQTSAQNTSNNEPPQKKPRLENEIVLESSELTKDEDVEPVVLKLKTSSASDKSTKSDTQFPEQDVVRWAEIVKTGLQDLHSEQVSIDSSEAVEVMNKFTANLTQTQDINKEISNERLNHLRSLYAALAELLRHFWSCFPAKTPELEQKVEKMMVTLKRFESEKLRPVYKEAQNHKKGGNVIKKEEKNSLEHLFEMLHCAYAKHTQWTDRRISK